MIDDGYYWVRYLPKEDWEVAHILRGKVWITGSDGWFPLDRFELGHKITREPVAVRHSFDGYGWQYADDGNGSDWLARALTYPDAEPLYEGGAK